MKRENERFKEIALLERELNSIQDFDILLEKILFVARKIVNADAGSIFVKDNDELVFNCVQNETLEKDLPPGKKLIYNASRLPINKKSIAGCAAETGRIINIKDVYTIPKNSPYKFNKHFDEISNYRTKSVVTIPLKTNLGKILGVLQIINAKDRGGNIVPFLKEDEPFLIHFANTASSVLERAQMTRALLERMIQMAELRDPKETGAHVNRVAALSILLYEQWAHKKKIPENEIEKTRDILRMAAMLHDVGKVAISDLILKKPSGFTSEEYNKMKEHTFLGARLFKDKQSEFDEIAAIVALNHHENWDGTGYPGHVDVNTGIYLKNDQQGNPIPKKENDIPIFGRIVALADVYDALSSKRVYKEAWDETEVFEEIKNLSGKKFDPELVEVFLESIKEVRAIKTKYIDR